MDVKVQGDYILAVPETGIQADRGFSVPKAGVGVAEVLRNRCQLPRLGDVPIEQPTKFELAINLKAAKALGIMIPQSI
jgi:putative ABC transport system substrate-binding protein